MRDLKQFTRKAIVLATGTALAANMLALSALPAKADGDKKGDGGGKKIIIVVGPVTKTHDRH